MFDLFMSCNRVYIFNKAIVSELVVCFYSIILVFPSRAWYRIFSCQSVLSFGPIGPLPFCALFTKFCVCFGRLEYKIQQSGMTEISARHDIVYLLKKFDSHEHIIRTGESLGLTSRSNLYTM